MRLIGRYNFAKAQNPQTGESIKIKMATVGQHATKSIKSIKINYVKLN
jgi:hypothetical protein